MGSKDKIPGVRFIYSSYIAADSSRGCVHLGSDFSGGDPAICFFKRIN